MCGIIIHQFSNKTQCIPLTSVTHFHPFIEFFMLLLIVTENMNFYLLNNLHFVNTWLGIGISYTEELYKKDPNDPDNHDCVITYLEPDILE